MDKDLKDYWIELSINTFKADPNFAERLNNMLVFYGFRWCLILLNIFKTHVRVHEMGDNKLIQLKKSKKMLSKINELIKNGY